MIARVKKLWMEYQEHVSNDMQHDSASLTNQENSNPNE
jgi:hypothetical protein